MNAFSLQLLLDMMRAFGAHTCDARDPKQALRFMDGKTPFAIHPLWCAFTILMEPDLPDDIRFGGARLLMFHDLTEDTTVGLPDDCSEQVQAWHRDMVYASEKDEMEQIWGKPPEIRLFKLYDKLNTMLDGTWMRAASRRNRCRYILRLAEDVQRNYGDLNIVVIANNLARYRMVHGFRRAPKPQTKE